MAVTDDDDDNVERYKKTLAEIMFSIVFGCILQGSATSYVKLFEQDHLFQ